MLAAVKMITEKFDWGLNQPVEKVIEIEVDADVVHKLQNVKVKDMNKIARGSSKSNKPLSLAIEWIGSTRCNTNGLASIALHLYNIEPGTRRKNAKHELDFTRAAYGI